MPSTKHQDPPLRWLASVSAGCFHAAEALVRGQPLAEARLAEALAQPAAALGEGLSGAGIDLDAFFGHLVPLSVGYENHRELASLSLTKTTGREKTQILEGSLAGWLIALKRAYTAALPGLLDELATRAGPIRGQWEARGAGLLAAVGRRTEPGLIAERADVVLVHPATGGGGAAYAPYNLVIFEGVQADPAAELPEVVRLGWLLSVLNSDLPKFSENISRQRLHRVALLAMVPAVLDAAQEVELIAPGERPLARALEAWHLDRAGPVDLATLLGDWWETYCESHPRWRVALEALDRLV